MDFNAILPWKLFTKILTKNWSWTFLEYSKRREGYYSWAPEGIPSEMPDQHLTEVRDFLFLLFVSDLMNFGAAVVALDD